MTAETQSTSGTTESTEAEGHGGGGLPQLRFEQWGGQIFWLLIIFAVLYLALSRIFTPRLRGVIDERARTISEAVETARTVQAEALDQARTAEAELAEARARSQRVAAEARAKSVAESAERGAVEDAKVAERVAAAEAEIRKARDAAMGNVSGIAQDITAAIVAKLTGAPASAAEIKAALAGREGTR
ncbi:MAG: hypothetical protein HY859_12720 [Caulobacterales bacterium]|nr:hypothetical protein [Caulobacterales bacterium]